MPFINFKKIIGLEVFTESGSFVGKISDLEIDVDTQSVLRYMVRARLGGIMPEELVIAAAEVVLISAEKMVVRDNTVKELTAKNSAVLRVKAEVGS